MIVRNDQCTGAVAEWIGEHFSWVHLGYVDEANGDHTEGNDFMGTV
jgi:hypothetical protein